MRLRTPQLPGGPPDRRGPRTAQTSDGYPLLYGRGLEDDGCSARRTATTCGFVRMVVRTWFYAHELMIAETSIRGGTTRRGV